MKRRVSVKNVLKVCVLNFWYKKVMVMVCVVGRRSKSVVVVSMHKVVEVFEFEPKSFEDRREGGKRLKARREKCSSSQ